MTGLTPWEGVDTPLARAFERAFERQDAVAQGGEHESGVVVTNPGDPRKHLLLVGTDMDPRELEDYCNAVAIGYLNLMSMLVPEINAFHETLEPEQRQQIMAVWRGALIFLATIGSMHRAATMSSVRANAEAAIELGLAHPFPTRPGGLAVDAAELRAGLTAAQRAELSADVLQTVLDLECDRLDRTAPTLATLGLGPLAAEYHRIAAELRELLETVGEQGRDS